MGKWSCTTREYILNWFSSKKNFKTVIWSWCEFVFFCKKKFCKKHLNLFGLLIRITMLTIYCMGRVIHTLYPIIHFSSDHCCPSTQLHTLKKGKRSKSQRGQVWTCKYSVHHLPVRVLFFKQSQWKINTVIWETTFHNVVNSTVWCTVTVAWLCFAVLY